MVALPRRSEHSIPMILDALVYVEVVNTWPAKNGKPGGTSHEILVLDMTVPSSARLRDMYHYRLTEEERIKHWGNLESKMVKIAVNEIFMGGRAPVLRGSFMSIVDNGSKPAVK